MKNKEMTGSYKSKCESEGGETWQKLREGSEFGRNGMRKRSKERVKELEELGMERNEKRKV